MEGQFVVIMPPIAVWVQVKTRSWRLPQPCAALQRFGIRAKPGPADLPFDRAIRSGHSIGPYAARCCPGRVGQALRPGSLHGRRGDEDGLF